jgi:uncharacterized protein
MIFNKFVIKLVHLYRYIWHPIFKGINDRGSKRKICIFEPTCSEYAIQAFEKYSFFTALKKSLNRLSRCKEGNNGGSDLP